MAEEVFGRFGGLDVLVNNDGDVAGEQTSWRDPTEESIDHPLAVDVKEPCCASTNSALGCWTRATAPS
ncbi:hypothetical protein [Nonomuraea sp. NPDC049480]|uniref:hypothetical protein n=1 Tax=Nonomuraea sp. NPDC049480 TaxID=3364353 RepID=UPI00379EDD3F